MFFHFTPQYCLSSQGSQHTFQVLIKLATRFTDTGAKRRTRKLYKCRCERNLGHWVATLAQFSRLLVCPFFNVFLLILTSKVPSLVFTSCEIIFGFTETLLGSVSSVLAASSLLFYALTLEFTLRICVSCMTVDFFIRGSPNPWFRLTWSLQRQEELCSPRLHSFRTGSGKG